MQSDWQIYAILTSLLWAVACFLAGWWWLPIWDRMTRTYVGDFLPQMQDLGMREEQIDAAMRWWGFAVLGTFLIFAVVLGMPPVALGVTYLVFVSPRFILAHQINKRRQTLRDQMVRVSGALVNSVRAGMSVPDGLAEVSQETPEPLGKEIRRIVSEFEAGRPLPDALGDVQQRLKLEVFTLFSVSLIICLERGGKITFALERISTGLQEIQRLERKLEIDTASGRRMALILGLFPFVFLMLFTLLDPESMGIMYTTFLGQCVLLVVGMIMYFAVRWCMWILDVEV